VTPAPAFVEALQRAARGDTPPLITIELRPPRMDLEAEGLMDAWIDLNRAIHRFTRAGHPVFLTDDAVGQAEEENLSHLTANLDDTVARERIVPFLTSKHSLDYCLLHAERTHSLGFGALTVLGGDRSVGPPRCVEHAWQLRERIRARVPGLRLGGWANPFRDPAEQAGYLAAERGEGPGPASLDFFLTQVVHHHDARRVEDFWRELRRRDLTVPGLVGIFHYRSANARTLERLQHFLPVPAAQVTRDFASGASAEQLTARSVRAALDAGAPGVYISNLGLRGAGRSLRWILDELGR